MCAAGYEYVNVSDSFEACDECQVGYWKDDIFVNSMTTCQQCPEFSTTSMLGSTSEAECNICKCFWTYRSQNPKMCRQQVCPKDI